MNTAGSLATGYDETFDTRPSSVFQEPKIKLEQKLMVGASAGVLGAGLMYPLDMVKVQMQSNANLRGGSLISMTLRTGRNIFMAGGLTGFYRGFGAASVGIAPEKALKLAVNDMAREKLMDGENGTITLRQEIIAGSITGFTQLFVTVPYESVKIRMQMQGPGAHQSARDILLEMGPTGIYRGFGATFLRDVPFCFIFFPLYSNLKSFQKKLMGLNPRDKEPFHIGLTSGIAAGAVSGALVTPADMLKTRIQQGLNGNKTMLAYAHEIASKEGLSALYRGWHTRMIVIAPMYGVVSLAFEIQKRWLSGTL